MIEGGRGRTHVNQQWRLLDAWQLGLLRQLIYSGSVVEPK